MLAIEPPYGPTCVRDPQMKVRELVQKLSEVNQDLDVMCYTEDKTKRYGKPGFILLEIEATEAIAGQLVRDAEGRPGLQIESGPPTLALVHVTLDF